MPLTPQILRNVLVPAAAFASTLAAQTAETLPRGLATTEGNFQRHVPLHHPPSRVQCGYDANATGWTRPKVIHTLTARRDRGAWLNNDFSLQMQVWVSSNGCNPAVTSNVFARNHGRDLRLFMKKKWYSFKKFAPGTGRQPFSIALKGDNTYVAVGNEIVIDWATYSQSYLYNSAFVVDAHTAPRSGTKSGRSTRYGTSCNTTSVVAYSKGHNENELFETILRTQVLGEAAIMWLSPKRVDVKIGGGCAIYADFGAPGAVFYPVPVITTAGFRPEAVFSWGTVPTSLIGKKIWSQGVGFPAQGGLRWSNGVEVTFGDFGPPYVVGHRYAYSGRRTLFDPDKDDAAFGSTGSAIVFKVN